MRPFVFALLCAVCTAPALRAQAPGDTVRLTLVGGETVTGSFVERSSEVWRIVTVPPDPRLVPASDVRRAERQLLRDRRRLRSQSMWWGMLIGAGAMYAVYRVEIHTDADNLANLLVLPLTAAGAVAGGAMGYAVGSTRATVVWRDLP